MCAFNGKLVAAVGKKVNVYKWSDSDEEGYVLSSFLARGEVDIVQMYGFGSKGVWIVGGETVKHVVFDCLAC